LNNREPLKGVLLFCIKAFSHLLQSSQI